MKTKHLFPLLLIASLGTAFAEEATTVTTTTVTTTTRTVPAERKAAVRKTEPARVTAWSWGRANSSLCDSTACRPMRFAWSTAPGG